ncbi:MAG: hypothetical protein II295_06115 [Akkermansia sp.]|nr:hypothetical protein [Akkermansia sp.]
MKRFLLIPSFAFLALSTLTSCQKEEKSALELTRELTAELQKVTDYRTAEAAAARVEVLNKRMQDASVRPFALNETALTRSAADDSEGSEGSAYAEALGQLAAEIGRVQASTPVATADGDIDRDKLVLAVGAANGSSVSAPAAERKKAGLTYLHDTTGTHETPGNFAEFYGSDKLREALGYKADPAAVGMMKFDSDADVPALPAPTEVAEEEIPSDEAVTDEPSTDEPSTDEPAAEDGGDEPSTDEPSVDEPSVDDGGDEPSLDDSGDEPSLDDSGDEPTVDEPSADDAGEEPSTDEPSVDDAGEEPSLDDSGDEPAIDDAGDDSGDSDIDLGDLGL